MATRKKARPNLVGITAISKKTGYSEYTLMNWHLFEGFPMRLEEGVWEAYSTEIDNWMKERK